MLYPTKPLIPTGLLVILMLLTILISGCSLINSETTITLEEQQVNEIIKSANAAAATGGTGLQVTGVDMKDDIIHVFVDYIEDGSKVAGSYDISLDVSEGMILSQITAVDLPGLTLSPQQIGEIAQKIADDFTFASSEVGGRVDILSITITEDSLQMQVRL
jgi:uncharacterized protein YceK